MYVIPTRTVIVVEENQIDLLVLYLQILVVIQVHQLLVFQPPMSQALPVQAYPQSLSLHLAGCLR